jgi:hypothetical protein
MNTVRPFSAHHTKILNLLRQSCLNFQYDSKSKFLYFQYTENHPEYQKYSPN